MAIESEIEVTYLASAIPAGLENCEHKHLSDTYFPADTIHARLRIRQKGDTFELTKKTQVDPNDTGNQQEENIALTPEEYHALAAGNGRSVSKTRYFMPYNGSTAEVDIFEGPLAGLVVVEFEFDSVREKAVFTMPGFCLADVTQEEFIAGGVLAGKSYADLAPELDRFHYQPLPWQVPA
jgi:CYTH domain-containing protein